MSEQGVSEAEITPVEPMVGNQAKAESSLAGAHGESRAGRIRRDTEDAVRKLQAREQSLASLGTRDEGATNELRSQGLIDPEEYVVKPDGLDPLKKMIKEGQAKGQELYGTPIMPVCDVVIGNPESITCCRYTVLGVQEAGDPTKNNLIVQKNVDPKRNRPDPSLQIKKIELSDDKFLIKEIGGNGENLLVVVPDAGAIANKDLGEKKVATLPAEELITSDEQNVRYLHRTNLEQEKLEQVFSKGLNVVNLGATATPCPVDFEEALRLYEMRHNLDQKVVVIELPRNKLEMYRQKLEKEGNYTSAPEDEFVVYDTTGDEIRAYLPGKYIKGYIERNTGKFVPNPNFGEKSR